MRPMVIAAMVALAAVSARGEKPTPPTVDPVAFREATERLKAKATSQPSELERLRSENSDLKREVESLKKRLNALIAERRAEADARGDNLHDPKLTVGMSIEQVEKVLGKGQVDFESSGRKAILYRPYPAISNIRTIHITFVEGKIASVMYSRRDPSEYGPIPQPVYRGPAAGPTSPPAKKGGY